MVPDKHNEVIKWSDEKGGATLTVDDAAEQLGISRNTAYACAKSGELPVIRMRHRMLVLREPFERMLRGESAPKTAA